jgi:hypothetical protein
LESSEEEKISAVDDEFPRRRPGLGVSDYLMEVGAFTGHG